MKRHAVVVALAAAALVALPGCGTADPSGVAASPVTASPTATASPSPTASTPPSITAQPTPTGAATDRVYWEDLEPGMCVILPESDNATSVTVVGCRAEHEEEVFLSTTLPGTTTWPGDDAVDKAAGARCEAAFGPYVGVDYDSSTLELDIFTTDPEGWADGDRTLICLLYDPDHDTLTSSLKGSQK